MPEEIKVSRPAQPSSSQPAMRPEHYRPSAEPDSQKESSKMPWIVLGVIVVVLVVVGLLFRDKLFASKGSSVMPDNGTDVSGYQAVFLTNGQVYFGKLSSSNTDYPVLTDIYYLQVVQPPLQGQQSGTSAAQSQQSISLVKLGNELHGPVDEMHISKQQILFYEDLKTDGQVVKAIQAYKTNPSGAAAPAPAPAANAPVAPTPTK